MRLGVFLNGQIILDLDLDPNQVYIAGRSSECQIVLKAKKRISRQHAKIFFDGNTWCAELLSQSGHLLKDGVNHTHLTLEENSQFSIAPYKFKFMPDKKQEPKKKSSLESSQVQDNEPQSKNPSSHNNPLQSIVNVPTQGDMESTQSGLSILTYLLQINYPNGEQDTLKLEGHAWTAGRDPQCEIYLRSDSVSRKHFEIQRKHDGFYIIDLGSSNGTKLNQKLLTPNLEKSLHSNDSISIDKISLTFIIKNSAFDQELIDIPEVNPQMLMVPVPLGMNLPMPHEGPGAVRMEKQEFNWTQPATYETKHKIRAVALLLLPILLYSLFTNQPKKKEGLTNVSSTTTPYDALKPEQKESIKHSLELAQLHYNRKKFSSCISEISKINLLLPMGHGNSKELQVYCESGKKIEAQLKLQQEREEDRRRVELKINKITSDCKDRIQSFQSIDEANLCLAEAIELNPADPAITEIYSFIERKFEKIAQEKLDKKNYQANVEKGRKQYQRALAVYNSGDFRKSIPALKNYLNTSLPDPHNNKAKARKLLSVAQGRLNAVINSSIKRCEEQLMTKNYKSAMAACDKALSQDPQNAKVSELKSKIRQQLSIKMKEFYENASIEENYGNIEAAKELWFKITSEDFANGSSYYEKAKLKLKLYGL